MRIRFSIESAALLTIWVAISVGGISYYYSNYFLNDVVANRRSEVSSLERRLQNTTTRVASTRYRLPRETTRHQDAQAFIKLLSKEFEQYAEQTSQIVPQRGNVSIRRIPLLSTAQGIEQQLRIYVPAEMNLQLDIERRKGTGQSADSTALERNITIALTPGEHRLELQLGTQDIEAANTFRILLDGTLAAELKIAETASTLDAEFHRFQQRNQTDFDSQSLPVILFDTELDHSLHLTAVIHAASAPREAVP